MTRLCYLVGLMPLLSAACGDDSPRGPDSGPVCECPLAEPPLAGRIIEVTTTFDFHAPEGAGLAACPDGAIILGGSCILDARGPGPGSMMLYEAGRRYKGANYTCQWNTDVSMTSTGRVTAICLVPQ